MIIRSKTRCNTGASAQERTRVEWDCLRSASGSIYCTARKFCAKNYRSKILEKKRGRFGFNIQRVPFNPHKTLQLVGCITGMGQDTVAVEVCYGTW